MAVVGITIAMVSCEKEDVKPPMTVKNGEVILFRDATEKLEVENATSPVSYEIENDFIAQISEDGIITGGVRGNTTVTVISGEDIATCDVSVKTLINYIPEPNLDFGQNMATIKSTIATDGEVITDDDFLVQIRKVDGSNFAYMYLFEDNKLESSAFTFNLTAKTASVIADFLLERYVVLTAIGTYEYAFISPDEKMAVALSLSSDSITVIYMPIDMADYRSSKMSEEHEIPFNDLFRKFTEKITK